MADLLVRLLQTADAIDASDIHLTVGEPAYLRVGGKLVATKDRSLSESEIRTLMRPTLTDAQLAVFEQRGYVDYAFETEVPIQGVDRQVRYRMHLYRSRGMMTASLRRIRSHAATFEELHLPPVYEKAIGLRPKGIIIIGGETGSGKSTTLAAMLDYINSRQQKHLVTIEDPIEYVLVNKKSKINQRELGHDFIDFPDALRAVVREDPDVIMIGELRDSQSVRAAVAAAETGHLVLTSLHTASATEALHRILYFFPPHEENLVRQNLASTLIAIMNQMLLPCVESFVKATGAKRVPATEVLLNTPVVKEYLRDREREVELANVLASDKAGGESGSHDFNSSLKRLCHKEAIDFETALRASLRPEQLQMVLRGIG